MVIAIDFDGTCVKHRYPSIGDTVPHAVRVMKRLVERGHQLILYTMRSDNKEVFHDGGLDAAVKWFEDNEIPLWSIQVNPTQSTWTSSPKTYAQIYIDDAAIGCPLIYPKDITERPYVDWLKVEQLLYARNVFKDIPDVR